MNNYFTVGRFFKYFKNEWRLKWKTFVWYWGLILLLTFFFFLFFYVRKMLVPLRLLFMYEVVIILILQAFVISLHFDMFQSKQKTRSFLLLPVSRWETFTCKIFNSMILCPGLGILYIFLIPHVGISFNWWMMNEGLTFMTFTSAPNSYYIDFHIVTNDLFVKEWVPSVSFFISTLFLVGACTFRKLGPLKMLLIAYGIILSVSIISKVNLLNDGMITFNIFAGVLLILIAVFKYKEKTV